MEALAARARVLQGSAPKKKRTRLDVHGRIKPKMRGWIHAAFGPLAVAACIVICCLAPAGGVKAACAIYLACTCVLFGNSALYHIGNWGPKMTDALRRIDHANIFLLIAGTYTPLAFALPFVGRVITLSVMWAAAGAALLINFFWINCPRWLSTSTYIVIGVSGISLMPFFWMSATATFIVVILTTCGGILYIAGAVIYGARHPDPWPKMFGFHEIFHVFTVLGYLCEMSAVFVMVFKMR